MHKLHEKVSKISSCNIQCHSMFWQSLELEPHCKKMAYVWSARTEYLVCPRCLDQISLDGYLCSLSVLVNKLFLKFFIV